MPHPAQPTCFQLSALLVAQQWPCGLSSEHCTPRSRGWACWIAFMKSPSLVHGPMMPFQTDSEADRMGCSPLTDCLGPSMGLALLGIPEQLRRIPCCGPCSPCSLHALLPLPPHAGKPCFIQACCRLLAWASCPLPHTCSTFQGFVLIARRILRTSTERSSASHLEILRGYSASARGVTPPPTLKHHNRTAHAQNPHHCSWDQATARMFLSTYSRQVKPSHSPLP